ncbi:MAG TPA: aldehyde ferredoxin oxidoreductase family protein [Firmicutes bacterium]|nr:aldehyde ferredoxin oxidoreductase family protein [Bacillota bacterium]
MNAGYGYTGKILLVDLSSGTIASETHDDVFYRTYLGGKGLVGYYLLREVPPRVDPLGPKNVLVFATGVLAGTNMPGFSRVVIGAKSPLTDGYGESEVGGSWGAELKRAGFDAIVIKGASSKPVYLEIVDGSARLVDASELWGLSTSDAEAEIARRVPKKPAVMSIGPAGERLVKFACIMQGDRNAAGRGGLGAVMGSKKLKAIAVSGSTKVKVKNPDGLSKVTSWFAQNFLKNAPSVALHEGGTAGLIPGLQAASMLPTKNFSRGRFDGWEGLAKLGQKWLYETKGRGCWACPIRCKRTFEVKDGSVKTINGMAACPEYETVASFGSNLCIDDPLTVLKANVYCNEMGLDTISAGVTIAFAMECVEKGLIDDGDLRRLEVKFGNASCVLPLLELITDRKGIGDLLAEGSMRAASRIGMGAEVFAMHVKGQELPMHDPRGKTGVGMGYALADYGADHMTAAHDPLFAKAGSYGLQTCAPLGLLEPVDPLSLNADKVRLYLYLEMWWDALKCLGACFFCVVPRGLLPVPMVVEAVAAGTGWDVSLWEIMKAGERAGCMARAFNTREGYGAERDQIPARLFESNGNYPGISKERFDAAIRQYYKMRGWDPVSGAPSRAKLDELGLYWVS